MWKPVATSHVHVAVLCACVFIQQFVISESLNVDPSCESSTRICAERESDGEEFVLLARGRPTLRLRAQKSQDAQLQKQDAQLSPATRVTAAGIMPADLWAIHDIAMIGHYGVMLKGPHMDENKSQALDLAQSAATTFAGLLPLIHPVAECRTALAAVEPASLEGIANTSWTCLGLSAANFTDPFTSETVHYDESLPAAFTSPKFQLGACNGSVWPRACSFWVSFHTMAVRADLHGKGKQFFNAILQILAGGPLFCVGCTNHARLLAQPILPIELLNESSFVGV